jgi:hypothetical protein
MTLPKSFTVRVYAGAGHPVVVPGGLSPLGVYVELVTPHGTGSNATPGRRIGIDALELIPLPAGSDAEFEVKNPFPVDMFKSR